MSGALDAPAAIVGFTSLSIQLFDGCIKGFVLLTGAQNLGSRADVLECELDWEHYRFCSWASAVGLLKSPPELNVRNVALVHKTIENIQQLLLNTEKLKTTYGLELEPTDEEIEAVTKSKRGLARYINKARPNFINDVAKVYQSRNGPLKKLKWSALDAERFKNFITDIRDLNKYLADDLDRNDLSLIKQEQSQTMRAVISQGPDKDLLRAIEFLLGFVDNAVAETARLRSRAVSLEVIQIPDPLSERTSSPPLLNGSAIPSLRKHSSSSDLLKSMNDLKIEKHDSTRTVAQYEGRDVIVEWKEMDTKMEPKLKVRVANVASLLAEMHDPSFHCLQCIGYVKESTNCYGYLFEPPVGISQPCQVQTLRDLMGSLDYRPILNHRLEVAIDITETLLQLHTTGLLHKDLRSGNVLLFNMTPAASRQRKRWETYLGGYHFARADNPLEQTEDTFDQDYSDLYRHPATLEEIRPSYIKKFDLWSLACVLIELALWEPLPHILWRHLRQRKTKFPAFIPGIPNGCTSRERSKFQWQITTQHQILSKHWLGEKHHELRDSVLADVGFHAGRSYYEIVATCLNQKGMDDVDDSVMVQDSAVKTLKAMLDRV